MLAKAAGPINKCWIATGHKDKKGYAQAWYNGRAHWLHRLIFVLTKGEIPPFQQVHHTCHTTSCINPYHLTTKRLEEHNNDHEPF